MEADPNLLYGFIDLGFTIALIIVFYIKYGLKHKPTFKYDYLTELPDNMSPAEINAYLRHNNSGSAALISTILDLGMREFIQFETVVKKSGFLKKRRTIINIKVIKKNDINIKKYEQELLVFLDEVYRSGCDIKEYSYINKAQTYYFFKEWKALVKESIYNDYEDYFETSPYSIRAVLLTVSALNMLWLVMSCLRKEFILLTLIIPSISISIGSIAMLKRKSQRGSDIEHSWRAFRRFLKNFSKLERVEIPEISTWERYIVYAEALGVVKQALGQLPAVFPEVKEEYYGSWFNYYGFMYGEVNAIEAFSSLNTFLESLSKPWNLAFNTKDSLKRDEAIGEVSN